MPTTDKHVYLHWFHWSVPACCNDFYNAYYINSYDLKVKEAFWLMVKLFVPCQLVILVNYVNSYFL